MKGIRVNEEERYKDDDENIWMDSWIKFSMRMFGENPISSRVWIQTWENCHSQKYFPTLNCKLGKLYFFVFSKVVNKEFSVSKLVNLYFSGSKLVNLEFSVFKLVNLEFSFLNV